MSPRLFAASALAFALSACATNPFPERLENPRLGAAGWVSVEPLYVASPDPGDDDGARAAAEALDAKVDQSCSAPRASVLVGAERLAASDEALVEIARGAPTVTRLRVLVTACGQGRMHAVYPSRDAAGARVFLTGTPGGSIASLTLQRDVVDQVVTQAAGIIASSQPLGFCDAAANEPWVLDTALAERPKKGRWSELWTVTACGARRTITITFEETATGASFSAPIFLAEE